MTSALEIARTAAKDLANKLGEVSDNGRISVREYTIRLRIVATVDGQDEFCPHCTDRLITVNLYARTMDGDEAYDQACAWCTFAVLDGKIDTDPSYIVTIEQLQ